MKNFSTLQRGQVSSQLRQIRLDKNLPITDIAYKCDLSVANIDAIERGEAISFKKYLRLIRFYEKKDSNLAHRLKKAASFKKEAACSLS